MVEIKDFVLGCLRCCFKDICSLILTFSLNWREYKFLSFLLLHFADYSNYINEKKNEINKKQERARKLIDEFVKDTEAICQGREKDILRVPGQLVGTTGFLLVANFPPLETINMIKNNITFFIIFLVIS